MEYVPDQLLLEFILMWKDNKEMLSNYGSPFKYDKKEKIDIFFRYLWNDNEN